MLKCVTYNNSLTTGGKIMIVLRPMIMGVIMYPKIASLKKNSKNLMAEPKEKGTFLDVTIEARIFGECVQVQKGMKSLALLM